MVEATARIAPHHVDQLRRSVVVSLPDIPERVHFGELPANVDVRWVPPEPEPTPDLAEVEFIDAAALVAELRAGRIRAALDVTDPEPLPPDHPLWGLPNVLISPHMAGDSPSSTIRSFELAGDQIRRFAAGEPLINVVDRYLLG